MDNSQPEGSIENLTRLPRLANLVSGVSNPNARDRGDHDSDAGAHLRKKFQRV